MIAAVWMATYPQVLINPALPDLGFATFGYISLKLQFMQWLALFIQVLGIFPPSVVFS